MEIVFVIDCESDYERPLNSQFRMNDHSFMMINEDLQEIGILQCCYNVSRFDWLIYNEILVTVSTANSKP